MSFSSSRQRVTLLREPIRLDVHAPTDEELVLRARDDDRGAKQQLFTRYVRRTSGIVHRLMGQDRDLEDLVQDSFVQAFDKLHTLADPRAFGPWLFRIATGRVVDTLRRRSLLRRIGLWPKEALDTEKLISTAASAEITAELQAVYSVLERFPADERVALVLRRVEELTLEEIASYTGWSLATVKRQLVRAELRLQALTEKERTS